MRGAIRRGRSRPIAASPPLRSHLLVAAQLAAVAGCCWPPAAGQGGGLGWLALCVAGAGAGGWTLAHNRIGNFGIYPERRTGSRLVMSGPYRYSRHPMYVALTLMMAGIAGYNGGLHNGLAFVVLLLVVHAKATTEERYLHAAFHEYAAYVRRTPRYLGPRRHARER